MWPVTGGPREVLYQAYRMCFFFISASLLAYPRTCSNINWKSQKFSCLYPKYINLVVCSIPTSRFFFDFFWRTCLSPPFFVLGPAWISYWMDLAMWHKTQALTNLHHPPRPRWSLFTTSAASTMPAMLCGLITGLTSRGATPQARKCRLSRQWIGWLRRKISPKM